MPADYSVPGLLVPGNTNLYDRPQIPNPTSDDPNAVSTVYSATFTDDKGRAYVVPRAADGRILTNEQAWDRYQRTKEHLGIFKNEESANAYAEQLHRDQAAGRYTSPVGRRNMPFGSSPLGVNPDADTPAPMSESLGMPAGMAASSLAVPAVAPPQAPVATPAPAATPAGVPANHIGRAIRSILGTQVDYKVDPSTGQTVAVPVKASGSQIFRGILAGALAGAAAGQKAHDENPQSGLMAGIAAGGGAGMTEARGVDAQKYQRAQEDFKNSIETRKASQELLMQQAQIAHMHSEDLHANAMADLMASDHIDKINETNNVLGAKFEEKGAVPSITLAGQNINGKEGNGYDIMAAVNKDPHALDAPQGYHRVHTQTIDTAGLKYKPGTGWVDAKTEAPVDMAAHTTHTFYDIPNNTMNEGVTMTNKEWNKAIGSKIFPNDDNQRTGTYNDLIAMKDKATKEAREAAQTSLDKQKVLFEIAMTNKQITLLNSEISKNKDRDIRADVADLTEQAKIAQKTVDSLEMSPEDKKQAQSDLRQVTDQLRQLRNRAPATSTTNPAANNPPANPVDSAFNFLAQYPPAQQIAYAQGSANLSPDQKAELIRRVQARVGPPTAATPAANTPFPSPTISPTEAPNPELRIK